MPLIIITGLPSSGKTYRAQQIHDYLSHRLSQDETSAKRTVFVVGSHHATQDSLYSPDASSTSRRRDEVYNSASLEKTARAEEFSAIKRGVSRDNVVIADCPNYIKGYRYQLWCEAKAASTRCCVVHVAAQEDECRTWNEKRLRAHNRTDEMGADENRSATAVTQSGKDVRGELVPESHTAIYGDRIPDQPSRSRSSSLDAGAEETDRPRPDDTMTLKSLFISAPSEDRKPASVSNGLSSAPTESYQPSTKPPSAASVPPYSSTTLSSLAMRYEPPSPFSRWDTPLFTIPTSDTHPPYAEIFDAIFPPPKQPTSKRALSQLSASARSATSTSTSTPNTSDFKTSNNPTTAHNLSSDQTTAFAAADTVRPHAATLLPTRTSASALQLLESSTLLVVRALLPAARAASAADGDGGLVSFTVPLGPSTATTSTGDGEKELDTEEQVLENQIQIDIPEGTTLTQPMLQQMRRKYTQLQRGRIAHGQGYVGEGGGGRGEVVKGFVRFLEGEFGGGGGGE